MIRGKTVKMKNLVLVSSIFCFILSAYVCLAPTNANAQHIDVFNIDFEKKNRKNKDKETDFIEVVERTTYKVAVEKEKLEKNDFSVHDLELIEIPSEDLSKFAWHIVEVFTEKEIEQTQTREAGNLKCTRSRKGTMYWLSNGKKHVNWGIWTYWKCTKGEKK